MRALFLTTILFTLTSACAKPEIDPLASVETVVAEVVGSPSPYEEKVTVYFTGSTPELMVRCRNELLASGTKNNQ